MKTSSMINSKELRYGLILSAILLGLTVVFVVLRGIWLALFFPINLPLSAKITDFEHIQFGYNYNGCKDIADLTYPGLLFQPFVMNLSEISPLGQTYRVASKPNVQFEIAFKQSNFTITSTTNGVTTSSSEEFVSDEYRRFKGTTGNALEIDLSKSESLSMIELLCSSNISLYRSSPTQYDAIMNPFKDDDSDGALRTSQLIPANASVIIILEGPVVLQGDSNIMADHIVITLNAKDEDATLLVGIKGSDRFFASLPGIKMENDEKTNTPVLPAGNSFYISSGSNIIITSPTGEVKFGAYPEITLANLLEISYATALEFPTLPSWFNNSEDSGLFINSDIAKDEITISGTTPRLIYNRKEYSISRWSQFPEYVQTGVFGLVIGAISTGIGVLWKRNENRKAKKSGDEAYQPEKGDFVCILDSGYVIAGKLIERPSFFSPYYVIQDAHRKHRDEESWEADIVKQINIKASRVEQHYIKEQ